MRVVECVCEICNTLTLTQQELIGHLSLIHEAVTKKVMLQKPETDSTPEERWIRKTLPLCFEYIDDENPASQLEKRPTDVAQVVCSLCQASFERRFCLKHLYEVHLRVNLFVCDLCDFESASSLTDAREHAKIAHASASVQDHRAEHFSAILNVFKLCYLKNENEEKVALQPTTKSNIPKPIPKTIERVPCNLCDTTVEKGSLRLQSLHVQYKHVKLRRYTCPKEECEFGCNHAGGVRQHLEKKHADITSEPKQTDSTLYAKKLQEMLRLCYGEAMPLTTSTPKETATMKRKVIGKSLSESKENKKSNYFP